jgi:hypothetical protein
MVQFPTDHSGLMEAAAAKLGMLLIIAPSGDRYKAGDPMIWALWLSLRHD